MLKLAQQRQRRRVRHRNLGSRISKHMCCSAGESEEECEAHSEESEEECMHRARQVPHSDGSESEVEASDSSDEEEEVEEEEPEVMQGQCHHNPLLMAQREMLRRHYHEGHNVESSEEEEEEEEESEYFDSEDEELLKEARLVHMRHTCHHTSEESSDLDEEAQLQQGKMSYQMAQHLLRKHHHHQQQKQMLEAAQRQSRKKLSEGDSSPEKKHVKPKAEDANVNVNSSANDNPVTGGSRSEEKMDVRVMYMVADITSMISFWLLCYFCLVNFFCSFCFLHKTSSFLLQELNDNVFQT